MVSLSSGSNALIKEVKALKNRKNREEKQQYFIEGSRFVEEALKEKAEFVSVFASEAFLSLSGGQQAIIKDLCSLCGNIYTVSDRLFAEMSDTETPQGILAVMRMKNCLLDTIIERDACYVMLDGIQDPGNMGTIIRTADAAGFSGVISSRGSVDVYNPKVLRSTMGSIFRIPVCQNTDLGEAAERLSSKGIRIYAAHLEGTLNYFDADMKKGTAIVIGNEANGISPAVISKCDTLIKLPMPGRTESLNASVAAGILIYEAVRQRLSIDF